MRNLIYLIIIFSFACNQPVEKTPTTAYVMVLGVAQDAGYPQMNCKKECCTATWSNTELQRTTSCLAIVDPTTNEQWIIDATPNIKEQLQLLKSATETEKVDGVLLTHAHMGHYTGLLHLGREVMGTQDIPVFAMPKMKEFLESNSPWDQLVSLNNIEIQLMKNDKEIKLADGLFIEPFLVPHRDEYSETVGFKIIGVNKSVLFIPDIDKWEKWDQDIFEVIKHIDIALLDGTFYSQGELPNRDMSEIPHPFIVESMKVLYHLNTPNRNKVHFIHFNHSNPAIKIGTVSNLIRSNRFNVAREGMIFPL